MDRGAWWATVHGVVRVGHDLAIKPPLPRFFHFINISSSIINCFPAQAMLSPDLGYFPGGSEACWEQMLRRISIVS